MKIALGVPSWPPGRAPNGIVTYASQLVPALRKLGHEVYILTYDKTSEDSWTIDLHSYSSGRTVTNRIMFRLMPGSTRFRTVSSTIAAAVRDLVNAKNIDVLEVEESFGFSYAISRLKLLPVVIRLHGPWLLTGGFNSTEAVNYVNRGRAKREGRAINWANFVTSPSDAALQTVKNNYGFDLLNSRVIFNAFDVFDESKVWNINSCDKSRLLFVGRFDALKGGDLVLRAFAELVSFYPTLMLTFVGPDRGFKVTTGEVQSFEQFVATNFPEWFRRRIQYYGEMEHSDVMNLRAKHFATIAASQHEMMPYSVLEAMALGCPLVATAVGGIPEVVKDGRNGLLVPSQNVQALVAACKKLLDDTALAARLGHQAWLDCRDLHNSMDIAKETIEAYDAAIDAFNRVS